MKTNYLSCSLFVVVAALASGCSVKDSGGGAGGGGGGAAPVAKAVTYNVQFITQPLANALMNQTWDMPDPLSTTPIIFEFSLKAPDTGATVNPSAMALTVSAFTDSLCTVPSFGHLVISKAAKSDRITVTSATFDKAQDIYLSVHGAGVLANCSTRVNVMSEEAATFSLTAPPQPDSGDAQSGTAGAPLTNPIRFFIQGVGGTPVVNVRVTVESQTSLPSDANGIAVFSYTTPTTPAGFNFAEANIVYNQSTFATPVVFAYITTGSAPITLATVMPDVNNPFPIDTPNNEVQVWAIDQYGNFSYPDQWDYAVGVYTDASCSTAAGFTLSADPNCIENCYWDTTVSPDVSDETTWSRFFTFVASTPGTYYFKLNVAGSASVSSCTDAFVVTP
jgi:hypothetical protein